MACHHEVLTATQEIVATKGKNEFTPIEVVRLLQERGTRYAESTIRTHVISRCCANAPPHHAVRYPYFGRIGKGRYRMLQNEWRRDEAYANR